MTAAASGCGSHHPTGSARSSGPQSGNAATTAAPVTTLRATQAAWRLPAPVSRAAVVSDGGQLVIAGGLATGDVSTAAVWSVTPATGSGSRAGSLAVAVHDMGGAVLNGGLFVFGGGASSTVATVQRWADGRAASIAHLPAPRSDGEVASDGTTAWIVGGFDGHAMDSDILSTRDGQSFTVAGTLVVPVRYPAVAWGAGSVWIVGGQLGTQESSKIGGQTDVVQRFDPATGKTAVIAHLPAPLGHATAWFLDGSVWVAGGQAGTTPSDQLVRVDAGTGAVAVAGALPSPRSDAGAAVVDDTAYLVGGETSDPAHPLDTVVILQAGSA